jgi:flagellar hook-associated protein 3 FlgL
MRVTTSNYSDNLIAHLQRIAKRQVTLQDQVSSGQRVTSAEDDPTAAGQVMKLNEQALNVQQYQKNIENHSEFASATHDVVRSLKNVLDRAQEIAIAADGLDSPDDLKIYEIEVDQLIHHAVQVANTTHRGEYLLGGTKSNAQPFTSVLNGDGQVTDVTFGGNIELAESEISEGVRVASRMVGQNESGSGERGLISDSRYGADLFKHLIQLRENLSSGDISAIKTTTRPLLENDDENLLQSLADNGALQSRLEASLDSSKDDELELEGQISKRTDVDLAEMMVKLNHSQTNYQAALQSAGSVLNLTLLDFLR